MYTTVSARLDSDVKAQAEQILAKLGLSHSAAISTLYSQIALQQGLSFEVRIPQQQKAQVASSRGISQTMREAVESVAKQYGVDRVWAFGSRARNTAGPKSDLDLRVDKGAMRGLEIGGFVYDLEQLIGVPVDVSTTPLCQRIFWPQSRMMRCFFMNEKKALFRTPSVLVFAIVSLFAALH